MTVMTKVNKRTVKKSTPIAAATSVEVPAKGPLGVATWSYRDLQSAAKDLGLKANGSKADLIERIIGA